MRAHGHLREHYVAITCTTRLLTESTKCLKPPILLWLDDEAEQQCLLRFYHYARKTLVG